MESEIQKILINPIFTEALQKIARLEKERIYCKHDLSHLLDVARIGYLYILENHLPISREQIYGAALLHDIGRLKQYEETPCGDTHMTIQPMIACKTPHHEAGAKLAFPILISCGYSEPEAKEIADAILKHGSIKNQEPDTLSYVLYMADKKSRLCFSCEAAESCNWPEEKKNRTIIF